MALPLSFVFRPLGWRDARTVAAWHYAEPYTFYDLGLGPLLASVVLHRLFGPLGALGYYAVGAADDPLIGVFSFYRQVSTVEIGLALRPDLTGRSLGLAFVQAGMDFGRQLFRPACFRLDVATFNQRAIRVYERAGFRHGRRFIKQTHAGPIEFMEMTRSA
jgi:ribosomal-protein-alanine N-acetyltransferase